VKIAISAPDRFQSVNLAQDVVGQILELGRLSEAKNGTVLRASQFTGQQEQFVAQLLKSQALPGFLQASPLKSSHQVIDARRL
jgi:hypothetical protein